jgi:hypothetical protein
MDLVRMLAQAGLLLAVVLIFPLAILVIGAPVALLVRLLIELMARI